MAHNNMLYGFTTKDFAVNDIQYSAGFTPVIYNDTDGQAPTGSLHVILVNTLRRSLYFDFGGDPAINIDEQILPAGVVVELIKIYRDFWKGNDFSLNFHKPMSNELYNYLLQCGITHFKIAEVLNEDDDQLNPVIDKFLLEPYTVRKKNDSAEEKNIPDDYIPMQSERLHNMFGAEGTMFFVSLTADLYIHFYETVEKILWFLNF